MNKRTTEAITKFATDQSLNASQTEALKTFVEQAYPPEVYKWAVIVLAVAAVALVLAYIGTMVSGVPVPAGLHSLGLIAFGAFASLFGYRAGTS